MSKIDILTSCSKDATEKPAVHLLPCKIEHNGAAEVDEYFQSCIKDDGKGMKKGLMICIKYFILKTSARGMLTYLSGWVV